MKKKILAISVLAVLSVGAVVLAAPLQDYSKGNGQIDLNYGFKQKAGSIDGDSGIAGVGATVGLGNRWGAQYTYSTMDASQGGRKADVREHQLRALYQLKPNISLYAGLTHVGVNQRAYDTSATGMQVGVIGQVPLTDRVTGWASVGVGDDVNTYEVGLGYRITPQIDAHLLYRDSQVDINNWNDDVKGWQAGLGYRF